MNDPVVSIQKIRDDSTIKRKYLKHLIINKGEHDDYG